MSEFTENTQANSEVPKLNEDCYKKILECVIRRRHDDLTEVKRRTFPGLNIPENKPTTKYVKWFDKLNSYQDKLILHSFVPFLGNLDLSVNELPDAHALRKSPDWGLISELKTVSV